MIIVYCSKPQQIDAVTPTPLTHRSHTCMRALALGHDSLVDGSRFVTSAGRAECLVQTMTCSLSRYTCYESMAAACGNF